MTHCFWDQYTYGIGSQQYGSFHTIEEALKTPFINSESDKTPDGYLMMNRDGRNLMIKTEKGYVLLGHQPMHLDFKNTDSLEWQQHAAQNNAFVPVVGAAEILKAHQAVSK